MSHCGSSQWLNRPGARLHWRRDAQGDRPLLMIHEMGGALNSWDAVVTKLAPDWDCLRSDLRGCGRSSPIDGTASLDALVDDQIAILEGTGLARPATIVASAIGAAVAVALAARYPQWVNRLVLLTPALGVPVERRQGLMDAADRIEAGGVEPFVCASLDAAYPEHLREPAIFAAFLTTQLANDPPSFAAYWRMLAGLDLRDAIGCLQAPVMILTGALDAIRPPDQVQRLPGAGFQIIESGHFMALQTPGPVAAAIADTRPVMKDSAE